MRHEKCSNVGCYSDVGFFTWKVQYNDNLTFQENSCSYILLTSIEFSFAFKHILVYAFFCSTKDAHVRYALSRKVMNTQSKWKIAMLSCIEVEGTKFRSLVFMYDLMTQICGQFRRRRDPLLWAAWPRKILLFLCRNIIVLMNLIEFQLMNKIKRN